MSNAVFFSAVLSFAFGVVFETYFSFGIFFGVFLIMLSGMIFLLSKFFFRTDALPLFLISISLLGVGLGVVRFDLSESPPVVFFEQSVSEEITMEAVVVATPDEREKNTQLVVRPEYVKLTGSESSGDSIWKNENDADTKILLFASPYTSYQYGEKISVTGTLEKPENFESEHGREFDYVHFLEKDDIEYLVFYPEVVHESYGHDSSVKQVLFSLKENYLESIALQIPEPASSLLGGLVVGAKQSLGEEWLEKFRETGLIHIVVLSGYNVTLVAYFIMSFFGFMKPKYAAGFGALGIFLFAILVGGGATVVRASLMAFLIIVARATGRVAEIVRLLFLVGFLMILWNPMILLYDPSFQLSFIATFGLLVLAPVVARKLSFIPETFFLRETASATIATQIFVLPMLLYLMGNVSLVAVPVNLLVLLLIPITMFVGFLAGVIGFVSTALATPFAYVSYLLLSYMLGVVDVFSGLPYAAVSVTSFPLILLVLFYVFYGFIFLSLRRKMTESESVEKRG